jgi:hypothetical protein
LAKFFPLCFLFALVQVLWLRLAELRLRAFALKCLSWLPRRLAAPKPCAKLQATRRPVKARQTPSKCFPFPITNASFPLFLLYVVVSPARCTTYCGFAATAYTNKATQPTIPEGSYESANQ